MAKYAILGSIAVGLSLMVTIALRARHVNGSSTSELAASSKENFLIFAVGMTIVGILMSIGVFNYLRSTTSVPDAFYYLFAVAVASQIVTGWIPYTSGKKRLWHHITSWTMAFSMLPLGALLLVNSYENQGVGRSNIGTVTSLFGLGLVLVMVLLLMWILIEGRKKNEMLRAQQLYIVCFMVLLLLRAYL